jgi:hypothetical protein
MIVNNLSAQQPEQGPPRYKEKEMCFLIFSRFQRSRWLVSDTRNNHVCFTESERSEETNNDRVGCHLSIWRVPRATSRRPSLIQPAADAIHRSLTRNSYYSHNSPSVNATTRSWVHSQQNTPGPPSLLS